MEKSFAVITGASSGIGFELAKQFGTNDFELLIVSSSEDIFEAQQELVDMGIAADALKVNLATYAGVENLCGRIKTLGKGVDALVINAGVGVDGEFIETDLREEINLINLNIVSTVHLVKRILPDMLDRNEGKLLFTSSVASQMPSPFEAVYGASKAFMTSFAESLRNEVKDSNIQITVMMPGPTNTNFFNRAGMEDTKAGAEMKFNNSPEEVARQGFEALIKGKDSIYPGSFFTKIQSYALKMLPSKARAQFHRKLSEPGSAHH